ncbi:MAG: putative collagen-binding domain-containing protein, partial [Chloroflexota bacterium]
FGYGHPESDLTADDFRSRAGWWADNSRALTFFETHLPFWRMTNCNTLIGNQNNNDGNGYCFGSSAEIYAIYLPDGGTKSLDLSGLAAEPYSVQWYDPRNGGALQSGTITQVTAGQTISIGSPPSETSLDWVALVARDDGPALPTPTPNPNATPTPDPSRFAVVSLTLINADTNQSIKTLVNGETLYLPSLPTSNLNVRADVNNPNFNTGSVQFDLNGQASYQTENVAPYSVFGDSNGDYEAWDLNIGTHSITATPFTGADGSGTAGDSLTISFTISNAMEPTPTLGPITGGSNGSYLPIIANGASVQNTPVDPTATPTMESSTIPNRTPTPTSQASGMSCNDADYADDNGLIVIEMESGQITGDWDFGTSRSDYTGSGYYQWGGSNQYNNPGSGLIEYKIRVETTGTYRFQWRSQIAVGSDSTEHNDSWLRFPDASEFYGLKGNHIVYPADTGQSPTPNGASKDGWFKVYISQLGEWGWQARTSDHDAHDIYVGFDQPGVYTMQISGRSTGHAIDRIVLYHENVSSSDATSLENSETICQP